MSSDVLPVKKDIKTATLLSFLMIGLGELYLGNYKRGLWQLAVCFSSSVFFAFLIRHLIYTRDDYLLHTFSLFGRDFNSEEAGNFVIILIIFSCYIWSILETRESSKQHILEHKRIEENKLREATLRVGMADFIAQLKQAYKLYIAGISNTEEYVNSKDAIIQQLANKTLVGATDDFFIQLMPLLENKALSEEEIIKIKQWAGTD